MVTGSALDASLGGGLRRLAALFAALLHLLAAYRETEGLACVGPEGGAFHTFHGSGASLRSSFCNSHFINNLQVIYYF